MSFFVPAPLTATAEFGRYSDTHPMSEWGTGATIHCVPDEPYAEYDIPVPGDGFVDFTADPAAIVFFGAWSDLSFAPYYTLTARLTPPSTFSAWFDPPACKMGPPFEWDALGPLVEGDVDGAFVDDTGAPLSMSITVSGAGSDGWILDGNLVNPSPVWPNTGGNTFGSILFTAAQVQAITATIVITSGPPSTPGDDGILQVHLQPYQGWDAPPPLLEQQGHIMGWA